MLDERREADWIARACSGDEAALQRLILAHHHELEKVLAHRIPQRIRAALSVEDILQEAYVSVFQNIETFKPRGPGSFRAWLTTIAERKLFDEIKRARTAKRGGEADRVAPGNPGSDSSAVDWLEILAVHERTPSQSVAGREVIEKIQEALDGLKPEYQQVLRLRYIEGLPVAATARQMNRTEGAVCQLCHRGLKRLEELVGDDTAFFSRGA